MKIFLIRHGESRLNALKIYQHFDTGLSQAGLRQAKSVAARFKHVKIRIIFCSEYTRATQTARIMSRATGTKIIHTKLLNEWRFPSEMRGTRYGNPNAVRILKERAKHINDPEWHYSDEENVFDLKKRVERFLRQLKKTKQETVMLVTHEHVIRMIMALSVFGRSLDGNGFHRIQRFLYTENTGITELEVDGKGAWRLITFNDYTHLR